MMMVVVGNWANVVLRKVSKLHHTPVSIFSIPTTAGVRKVSTCSTLREKSNYSIRYYYNMDDKHIGEGSTCPPLNANKVRIYSMRFCPFAQRTILVALAKGITHDVVNCNLKQKPEWLLEKNPAGKVPVVELPDGKIICESLIVCDYFDEVYDETRILHSLDPVQKAIDRMWIERFGRTISTFYKVLFAIRDEDDDAFEKHFERFGAGMKDFDKELAKRGTKYYGSNSLPGMLDYMVWPWLERSPAFMSFILSKYSGKIETFIKEIPKLNRWQEDMKEDFAITEFILPIEVHQEFIQSFLNGSPNYNILDVNAKL